MKNFVPSQEIYAVIPEGYGFVSCGKYTLVAELASIMRQHPINSTRA